MHLAGLCGIEVPVSGMVRCADGSWSYFVRRFDRTGHNRKVPSGGLRAGLPAETATRSTTSAWSGWWTCSMPIVRSRRSRR